MNKTPIEKFTGGSDELRAHMNRLTDALNGLLAESKQMDTSPDARRKADGTVCVKVHGFTSGNRAFLCKQVQSDGVVFGDAITAYTMTFPPAMPLTECFPNVIVGDLIWIAFRQGNDGVAFKIDWFSTTLFIHKCPP